MESREELLERLREATQELARMEHGAGGDPRALREELEDILDRLSPEAAIPPPPPSDALAADGLAVVVGHTALAQGARGIAPPFPADSGATPLAEDHEYAWNTDLARRIRERATRAGIRCDVFFRDGVGIQGAYANVRAWSPRATVELHFNASGGAARGTEVLYGHDTSKSWARTLQTRIVELYGRRGSEDRGVKLVPPGGRGRGSVTQLHPSALIEPFFGDDTADATLGVRRKDGLADAVLAAYAALAGLPRPAVEPGEPEPDVPEPEPGVIPDVPLLRELIATYRAFTPGVPDLPSTVVERLKGVTLAQWIEESGWARSDLATLHFNFAGMKGIAEVDAILREIPATVVEYRAHDGVDTYLRFGSIRDFIRGYFMFLDRSPYRGWREAAARSPHDFIRFIGGTWAQRPGYAGRVIGIEERLRNAGIVRADGTLILEGADADRPDDSDDGGVTATATVDPAAVEREGATPEFLALVAALEPESFAGLHHVLVAQWALESDWGRSQLARAHANFAGMEWSDLFEGLAVPVPHPADPARGTFCRFLSPTTFLVAYRHRLDTDPAFAGWTDRSGDAADFAAFLGAAWRPSDPAYAQKILGIARRIGGGAIG